MPNPIRQKTITTFALATGLVVLSVLGFIFGNVRDLLFGAPLAIHTINDGTTLSDGFLPVQGNAGHAKTVSINGRVVAIDRKGNFADGVLLSPGYNVLEIALRDQFGKEKVKTYHLVLSETDTVAAVNDRFESF
jgi:hypothetical protein